MTKPLFRYLALSKFSNIFSIESFYVNKQIICNIYVSIKMLKFSSSLHPPSLPFFSPLFSLFAFFFSILFTSLPSSYLPSFLLSSPPSSPFPSQAMWVPGSQTELVIVSDTFVKIYVLHADLISPIYYFVILTGKIKDATIAVTEEVWHSIFVWQHQSQCSLSTRVCVHSRFVYFVFIEVFYAEILCMYILF